MLKFIHKFIKKKIPHGMRSKLFIAILAIGIFLISVLGLVVTIISGNLLYNDAKTMLDNQAKQTVNAFDQYMNIIQNTVMNASRNKSIKALMNGTYEGYESYLIYRDSYSYLKDIHEFYDWIHIYILVKDIDYIMSSNPADVTGNYTNKGIGKTNWYNYLEEEKVSSVVLSNFIPPVSEKEEKFAYALKIRNIYNWEVKGYIIASIDKNVLNELLSGTSFIDKGMMLVLNEKNDIIYNSNQKLLVDDFSAEYIVKELGNNNSGIYNKNQDFYYSLWESEITNWKFISVVDNKYAKRSIFNFRLIVLGIVSIALILLIIVAWFTAIAYTKPIKRLIKFIHQVEENEFAGQIDLEANDEMDDLGKSFNAMIASVRQNQILRKRAQIYALQKQVDPHFLFNTFESIKSLARMGNNKSVIYTIEKLSDLFHYNTNRSGAAMSKIDDEIEHINNYLGIQKVRFGSRIEVNYDIDQNIREYWMPRIILQPIVENSLIHSMEKMKKGFRLSITGIDHQDDILFIIKDNGLGISKCKLDHLRNYIYDTENKIKTQEFGIGLKNIQERLYLYYGEKYGISIDSIQGKYTIVKIRIPKNDQGEQA